MWRIGERDISTVAVVDDEEPSRNSLGWMLSDADLEMDEVEGPLTDVSATCRRVRKSSDALICDHHLRRRNYATFNGADLVAESTRQGLPALLCTKYIGPDIDEIRPLLKDIPIIRRPNDLDEPEELRQALIDCEAELAGNTPPERKTWRTQLVVERTERETGTFQASIPAWEIEETIRFRVRDLPDALHDRCKVGARLFAMVNIGSESADRLYVAMWETN